MKRSVTASMTPTARYPASRLAQCPPEIVMSHPYAMGTHHAHVTVEARTPQAKIIDIITYVAILGINLSVRELKTVIDRSSESGLLPEWLNGEYAFVEETDAQLA